MVVRDLEGDACAQQEVQQVVAGGVRRRGSVEHERAAHPCEGGGRSRGPSHVALDTGTRHEVGRPSLQRVGHDVLEFADLVPAERQ